MDKFYNLKIMKNLLYLFLIGIFFSCGDDEEDVAPTIDPTEDNGYYYDGVRLHIQDTVGLKVLGSHDLNDTCVVLCGVKNKKLWIGTFDWKSGDEKFTWTSSNDYDLTRTRDMGYGEIVTFDIERMWIKNMYAQDNKNFRILFGGGELVFGGIWGYDLLFVHNGKEVLYRDVEYTYIRPWNDNNILAFNNEDYPTKCSLFSESGEKLYDAEPKFFGYFVEFIFPTDRGSTGWERVDNVQYIPINNSDFVAIYSESSGDSKTYSVYKGDIQHSLYIWSQPLFTTEYNAKCNLDVSINGNKLTITIHTVLYSGEKSRNVFEVNIETGSVTKL